MVQMRKDGGNGSGGNLSDAKIWGFSPFFFFSVVAYDGEGSIVWLGHREGRWIIKTETKDLLKILCGQ